MTKSLRKDFRREIKNSFSRFVSILLIVALGVAFCSGIMSSISAMQSTADNVYDKENLMDIQVVSTLGLTESDLEAISKIDGVEFAEGSYTKDFLCLLNSKEIVTTVISMPEKINSVVVLEGAAPEKHNECAVSREFLKASGVEIGDTITFTTGTDAKVFDTLASEAFKIVGVVSSSYFLNGDMGESEIGDGTVDGYVVLSNEAYVTNVYTSIYIQVAGAKNLDCNGEDYSRLVESVINKINAISGRRCDIRYSEVRSTSNELVEKARREYETTELTVQTELAESYQALLEYRQQFEDKQSYIEMLQNAEHNIPAYEKELAKAKTELDTAEQAVLEKEAELNEMRETQKSNLAELDKVKTIYDRIKNDPNSSAEDIKEAEDAYNLAQGICTVLQVQIQQTEKEVEQERTALDEAKAQYEAKATELETIKSQLATGEAQKLLEYAQELNRIEEEYKIAENDANAEIKDAALKLEKAEREINNLETPVWNVSTRNSIDSFATYKNDVQKLATMGMVIPLIFIVAAMLVTYVVMSDLLAEQKVQITTLKSLGYSKGSIKSKYLQFVLLASIIGGVIGVLAGEYTIPALILWMCKSVYYNLGNAVIVFNAQYGVISVAVATVCSVFVTSSAVTQEFKNKKALKVKKILIERISFVWERFNLSQKTALRNLFRYKNRVLMTFIAVVGCMALLITGVGIRNSVSVSANKQYDNVFSYDGVVGIDSTVTRAQRRVILSSVSDIPEVIEYAQATRMLVYGAGTNANHYENEKSAYLVIPRDIDGFLNYVKLQKRAGESISLADDGVIITENYAKLLGVQVGESVFIRLGQSDATSKEVKVVGITENYVHNYIYMTPTLYQSIYNATAETNVLFIKTEKDISIEELNAKIFDISGVTSMKMNEESTTELKTIKGDINSMSVVMIIAGLFIAFIFVCSLNNININERKRELATLKFVGFTNGEIVKYICRENAILTILNTIPGVFAGIVLHRFILSAVETETYMFSRGIEPVNIVICAIVTIVFAMAVNPIMYFKIKKIK